MPPLEERRGILGTVVVPSLDFYSSTHTYVTLRNKSYLDCAPSNKGAKCKKTSREADAMFQGSPWTLSQRNQKRAISEKSSAGHMSQKHVLISAL
jgi:hypothetical protein